MSMVFHFLKKDLRRNAWFFFIWFFLLVLEVGAAVSTQPPDANGGNWGWGLAMTQFLFQFFELLVLIALVPQLIQDDAVTGSTAFWLTRPVARGTLLLAKLTGLALVVLIPILIDSGALLAFGVSAHEFAAAVMEIVLNRLFFVMPIALIAALTASYARFVAVIVALAVVLVSVSFRVGVGPQSFAGIELDSTRYLIVRVLLIAGSGLVLTHQYLTRRTRRSVIWGIGILGTCLAVDIFWSKNLIRSTPVRSLPVVFDAAKAAVRISAGSLNNSPYIIPWGSVGKNIDGHCAFTGIPPEFLVQVRSVKPRLSTSDGMEIATLGAVSTIGYEFDPPATSAISAAIAGIPVESLTGGSANTTFVTIDHATFDRYQDSPVKLVEDIDLVVSRYELTVELPLVVDGSYAKGGLHVRIENLIPNGDGLAIMISESSLNLRFSGKVHGWRQLTDPRQQGDPIYLLVNRGRREAVLPSSDGVSSNRITNFWGSIVRQKIKLPFAHQGNPRVPIIDREWLAGAALVRLERVPVAEFSRTAEVGFPKLGEPWLSIKAAEEAFRSKKRVVLHGHQTDLETAISINKSGVVTLEGKVVTDEELKAVLIRKQAADADASVAILSEDGSDLNKTTLVMDVCRAAGVRKIRLRGR